MSTTEVPLKPRPRIPEWLRLKLPTTDTFGQTRNLLDGLKLHTVCESAKCPNHWECWSKGTATFMIAGDRCTRACGFCAVSTAKPLALETDEPQRVAEATRRMNLKHVVITAVARDDIADGGAEHFRQTIEAVRTANPGIVIEVLVPDFLDKDFAIDAVLSANPHVYNHNLETVRRLTPEVRSRATYDRSLSVLRKVKEKRGDEMGVEVGEKRVHTVFQCLYFSVSDSYFPSLNVFTQFILYHALKNIEKNSILKFYSASCNCTYILIMLTGYMCNNKHYLLNYSL